MQRLESERQRGDWEGVDFVHRGSSIFVGVKAEMEEAGEVGEPGGNDFPRGGQLKGERSQGRERMSCMGWVRELDGNPADRECPHLVCPRVRGPFSACQAGTESLHRISL